MSEEVSLQAEKRTSQGKGEMRRLRATGKLPAVIYGDGEAAETVQIDTHEFKMLLQHYAAESILIDLVVDGASTAKVVLKDIQYEPLHGHPIHADFQTVNMTQKLTFTVSLNFVNEPKGVTLEGGVLETILRELEIECLPSNMIDHIDADIGDLAVGDSLRVEQLDVPADVEVLMAGDVVVANVHAPRVSADEDGEGEGEGEEGAEESGEAAAESGSSDA